MRVGLRIVFSFLFSLPLAAQSQRIVLDPPGPTSAASVVAELYVTCDPVPLDPRYRVKVRVYMLEPFLTASRNGVVRFRRGDQVVTLPFAFVDAEEGLRIVPHYAEVDLPQGTAGERVNVEIALPLDATGWAFASVTNNETQQVTIVAPN